MTVVGFAGAPLLAIAACGTPQELAIGVVAADAVADRHQLAQAAVADAADRETADRRQAED